MTFPIHLITDILAIAIATYSDVQTSYSMAIPLRFCYSNFGCHYTSAVALQLGHKLSPKIKKTPLEIAQEIYQAIPPTPRLAIAITVEGMLNFTLTEAYILECIEAIEISDLSLDFTPKPQKFRLYTHTQYAYARSCSLLRLAELNPVKSQDLKTALLNSVSTPELGLWLIAIAETINESSSQSNQSTIKQCQNLTVKFLEYSDRTLISDISEFQIQLIKITKKLLYTLASGYINLPEYL